MSPSNLRLELVIPRRALYNRLMSRLCILPEELVANSREAISFLRLPHPRTGFPSLYLPCNPVETPAAETPRDSDNPSTEQKDGLLEVQAVTAPDDQKRSWFVGDSIISDGRLFVMTQYDPLFLLVAILLSTQESQKSRSLPYSDLFEEAATSLKFAFETNDKGKQKATEEDEQSEEQSGCGQDVVSFGALACVRKAADQICDVTQVAADLHTYRLSMPKLMDILKAKVDRLATKEVFTSAQLPTLSRLLAREGLGDGEGIGEEVMQEARQKSAVDVIGNYLPEEISRELRKAYSFTALQSYLDRVAGEGSLASDHISGLPATDPMAIPPASKTKGKTTTATNGKKKSTASKNSKGVEALKKVSKQGMKPLTSFFGKAPK